jgi:uncharacterized protein
MSDKRPDPQRLDLRAFTRDAGSLQGELPLAALQRLAPSLLTPEGDDADPIDPAATRVAWRAAGEQRPVRGGEPELWLHLQAGATVRLECQRCLQPMVQALSVDRHLRFVDGEDQAARLDEDSDDDVLALPPSLDLHALIEDELILALPLVPRHEACSQPLPMSAADAGADEEAPHAFAALARLRPTGSVN